MATSATILEQIAAEVVGATLVFNGQHLEQFNAVDVPFLNDLENQGVLRILSRTKENVTGKRHTVIVVAERLR